MGDVDTARLQALMAASNLDGLLVVEPENFAYFAGAAGFPVTIWRRAGPASVVVASDATMTFVVPHTREQIVREANPQGKVLAHDIWIERIAAEPQPDEGAEQVVARATAGRRVHRPQTYDEARVHELLHTALDDAALLGKRVGVECEFTPALDFERLRRVLNGTQLVDSSDLIRELRIIKTPAEIAAHRLATQLAELGISGSLQGLDEGTVPLDIRLRYAETIYRTVRERRLVDFEFAGTAVNVGPYWDTGDPLRTTRPGDLIQFDCGTQIHGSKSDIGRTFSFGPPTDVQQRIESALLAGFDAGLAELRPGRRFCDVFQAAQQAVRDAGFPSYFRGHVGHSIGSETFGEEWPFFSATEERVLEPGMVVAFEMPYYITGVGAFQNEDNFLITESGHESFNQLPMELTIVGI